LKAAHAKDLIAGMHCYDPLLARSYSARGFDVVTVSSDAMLLRAGLKEHLRVARSPGD
jgi:2-keto-3-deoxy-L-rhamnonate aldolase RhmA